MKFLTRLGTVIHRFQRGLLVLVMLPVGLARGAPPEVMRDFFRYDYGGLLPPVLGGATGTYGYGVQAVALGGGGWLTAWVDSKVFSSGPGQSRVRARVVPAVGGIESGEVTLDGVMTNRFVNGPQLSMMLQGGDGGGWVAWAKTQLVEAAMAVWIEGRTGRPVGQPVAVSPPGYVELVNSAGDGTTAWIFSGLPWRYFGSEPLYGAVLRGAGANPLPPILFSLLNKGFRTPMACAGGGRCLLSEQVNTGQGSVIRTVMVGGDGSVLSTHDLTYVAGWLGAIPAADGFYGVWSTFFLNPQGAVIYGREMTLSGEWKEGSVAEVIAPVGALGLTPVLKPSPTGGVLSLGGTGNFYLRAGQPLVALPSANLTYNQAYDGGALLQTGSEEEGVLVARRFTNLLSTPEVIPLASGSGRQEGPSLAWTERGPQVMYKVDGYGKNEVQQTITGFNQRVGGESRFPLTDPAFSTAAQAWQGNDLQLVAYRQKRFGMVGQADPQDPDDVVGQLFSVDASGELTRKGAIFPIASGTRSQRGVSVARFGTGFLVAWREEAVEPYPTVNISSIRAALVSAEGVVQPPGGRLIDISLGDLSAVSVAERGMVVWKYGPTQGNNPTGIRAARLIAGFPDRALSLGQVFNVSPPQHDAIAPQVVSDGAVEVVAWRDRGTKRIYCRELGDTMGVIFAVSPERRSAREPAVTKLTHGRFAIFWLEEKLSTVEVWMAIFSSEGISEPQLVTQGRFNRDTLVASGDGLGRVALSVQDLSAESPGLRVWLVAPQAALNGGLAINTVGAGLELSWDPSVLFPSDLSSVETSVDLRRWEPLSMMPTLTQQFGRTLLGMPLASPSRHQFFRLKARLKSGS